MQGDPARALRVLVAASKVFAVGFFGLVIVGFAAIYFLGDGCKNAVQSTVLSPNGTQAAIVFERNCGATTGFSAQVSVVPASNRKLDGGGNALVADTDRGAAPSASYGGPEIRLKWLSESSLSIEHHSKVRLFKSESKVGSVVITYAKFAQ
jgi:hypothetical protein